MMKSIGDLFKSKPKTELIEITELDGTIQGRIKALKRAQVHLIIKFYDADGDFLGTRTSYKTVDAGDTVKLVVDKIDGAISYTSNVETYNPDPDWW